MKCFDECYTLQYSINMGSRQGRHSIAQDSGIAPLEEDSQPAPEVGCCLSLLLPRVPGKGSSQFLHLPLCSGVPTAKGFGDEGKESNPLPPALLLCSIRLPAVCVVQGVAGSVGCT